MCAIWCGEIVIKSIDRNESRHQHLAHCNLWNIYLPNINTTSSSTRKKEVSCVVKFIERESVYCTIYILQIKLYYLSRLIPIWWWRVLSKSHTRHEFQIITLPKVLAILFPQQSFHKHSERDKESWRVCFSLGVEKVKFYCLRKRRKIFMCPNIIATAAAAPK